MSGKLKPAYLNLVPDHITLLLSPEVYSVYHVIFRALGIDEVLYSVRKKWREGGDEVSLTYALTLGKDDPDENRAFKQTALAIVQPSEPSDMSSHVRTMLESHSTTALVQHIALRTSDLLGLHQHFTEHGVNFITPILAEKDETGKGDLLQVFSGEIYEPGTPPSGVFLEFLERNVTEESLKRIEERNREAFFRDSTFLGLYGEKEREYQSGNITPFIDPELFHTIRAIIDGRNIWELDDSDGDLYLTDIDCASIEMRLYATGKP